MTDDSEFGRLPRYVRELGILAGRIPSHEDESGAIDHGVLSPFSGLLDVRVERGRAPTIDLSYLALEPLVARALVRAGGDDSGTRPAPTASEPGATATGDTGGPDRTPAGRSRSTPRRSTATGDAGGPDREDRSEPTVREVIHDESGTGTKGDDTRDPKAALDDGARLMTVLDPDPTRVIDQPVQADEPDEGADDGEQFRDALTRTTVARSTGDRSTPADAAPSDRATERPAPGSDGPAIEDRPEPSFGIESRPSGASNPDGRSAPEAGSVPPPRMVTKRRTGTVDRGETGRDTAGRGTERPNVPGTDSIEASPSGASDDREASDVGGRSAGTRRDEPPSGGQSTDLEAVGTPRLVVDRNEVVAGVDGSAWSLMEASADPESRLIDRLYRALQERDAIERRRRGDR